MIRRYSIIHFALLMVLGSTVVFGQQTSPVRLYPGTAPTARLAVLDAEGGEENEGISKFTSVRFQNALLLSIVVPGAGQTYLGYTVKGPAFTVLYAGSLVATLVFQSDIIANNQRLEGIESKYSVSGNYTDSEEYYTLIQGLHHESDRYKTKRNIFGGIAAAVWVLNITDILFNSDDLGKEGGSQSYNEKNINIGIAQVGSGPGITVALRLP